MTDVDTAPLSIDPDFASVLMADLLTSPGGPPNGSGTSSGKAGSPAAAPLTGQEAAVVGTVRGLDLATDWLVPYYRDVTGFGALGDEFMEQLVVYWRGHPDGGRIPNGVRCLPVQISLATQLPHAAGLRVGTRRYASIPVSCAPSSATARHRKVTSTRP